MNTSVIENVSMVNLQLVLWQNNFLINDFQKISINII